MLITAISGCVAYLLFGSIVAALIAAVAIIICVCVTFGVVRKTERVALTEMDWLDARHFDYRSLIKKGLALEAPEGMYNV